VGLSAPRGFTIYKGKKLDTAQKQKNSVATLSVISNSILIVIKLAAGLIIGSVSVISEAIHSGMDLMAAIIALFAVQVSGRSPDTEHPFGHGKIENISAAIEALLILVAAIWIIYEAIMKLISPHPLETIGWGILVMGISSILNLVVSQMLFNVGTKTESAALMADGTHLRTDVFTSMGVMAGLGAIWTGTMLFPHTYLYWIDPVAGIIVAILILRAAYHLTKHAVRDLMDASSPPEEVRWINEYLSKLYPTVHSFHRLRTRRAGPKRFIDFHMVVGSDMTVQDSHAIADKISADFSEHFPYADIILHVEPCDGTCDYACISGCLLPEDERKSLQKSKA
jgi:cation diffusion facilitator family transporter